MRNSDYECEVLVQLKTAKLKRFFFVTYTYGVVNFYAKTILKVLTKFKWISDWI